MDNVTEALRKGNRAYNSAYTLAARLALKEAVKDMFAKPSPVEIIGILLSRAERSKGKKRREALAMLDKYVTDTYPPVKGAPMSVIQKGGTMNYKNLIGKTVFDFCNDAEILAKVTGFSAPLESKEYIEGCAPVVHAQMLQSLAIETKDNELYNAAQKYEYECWKEQYSQSQEDGCIID